MNAWPQDVFASLKGMPAQFERAFRDVPAPARRWQPESWDGIPGERFCAADQACHIRDIEIDGYQVRIRRILEEHEPDLVSIDSYALAAERRYEQQDPLEAVAQFAAARKQTLELLREVHPQQLARRATFGEYGSINLQGLVRFLCSHDQQHLACMQWLLGKISSRR